MKTFKFVVSLILLSTIFVAFFVVLFASALSRNKDGVNEGRKNKIRLVAFAYIASAIAVVLLLMLI